MNIFGPKTQVEKRETHFAGTWYEKDAQKLRTQLSDFLSSARSNLSEELNVEPVENNASPKGATLALVVPHAGYMFSGGTAAYAYELAKKLKPGRIILLGPSHYAAFQGVALSPHRSFDTPLGEIELDCQTIDDLASYPMFVKMPEVHQKEHSLELQLAFIKHNFDGVPLIPLIVGTLNDISDVRMAGLILKRHMKENDLVVVSSDFTHYGPRYNYAPFSSEIHENVRKLDLEAFKHLRNADLQGFIAFHKRTGCTICGFYPCTVLLSMLPEGATASLLRYRTSRDTGYEDNQNSVSYLSIAFSQPNAEIPWQTEEAPEKEKLLTEAEKVELLKMSRQVITTLVKEGRVLESSELTASISPGLRKSLGVFVTLFKRKKDASGNGPGRELRGCIGYVWPIKPLLESVIDNSVGASTKDFRFTPVQENELEDIEIEISVLTPPVRVESHKMITIGRHGIVLYAKGRQSVFLPHVATEFGWSLEETLSQLSRKAGLAANDWQEGASFDVFESVMFEEHEFATR